MATIEQVEKLLQYARVSYEEARDALDACGGSVLDAIVYLERQGKVASRGGSVTVLPGNAQEKKSYGRPAGEEFADAIMRFLRWIGGTFDRFCDFIFGHISRHERHCGVNREDKSANGGQEWNGESEKL